jgi:hypothetical protein
MSMKVMTASAIPKHRARPILYWKAGAVLSPKNLIFSMDTFAFLKTHIDRALREWIRGAVWARVVLQRMHVLPEQLSSVVISEQGHGRPVTEKTGTPWVATKDALSSRIEYEPNTLLTSPQCLFGLFPLDDILGKRHSEPRSLTVLGTKKH